MWASVSIHSSSDSLLSRACILCHPPPPLLFIHHRSYITILLACVTRTPCMIIIITILSAHRPSSVTTFTPGEPSISSSPSFLREHPSPRHRRHYTSSIIHNPSSDIGRPSPSIHHHHRPSLTIIQCPAFFLQHTLPPSCCAHHRIE